MRTDSWPSLQTILCQLLVLSVVFVLKVPSWGPICCSQWSSLSGWGLPTHRQRSKDKLLEMFSPNETGFCPHCKGWKVKPEPHKNSGPHTENMRRAEADIIRSLCVMDALCSMSSYCSGLALVSGGNYCSLNHSLFSFFYRTLSNVHGSLCFSLDSWWRQTEIRGSVSSRAGVCSGQHLKQREYVCSVGFFLFTDASTALIWPQLQWAPPRIPAAVTSHLIKTRLAHMFLWQVSSSLCTGEMHWLHTPYGCSHPAEKAAILGSVNMWLHIWWWVLQSLACWPWHDFICTKMLFNSKRFNF